MLQMNKFNIGDKVKVTSGSLVGLPGRITRIYKHKVRIKLDIKSKTLFVSISPAYIEAVADE